MNRIVDRAIVADLSPPEQFTVTAVSDILPAGARAVELSCHGPGPPDAPRIFLPTLTTVVLGAG